MSIRSSIRSTAGRGRLFDSVIDTVGDTPTIRINNLGVAGRTIYAKAEFFNPAVSVKDRLALNVIEEGERSGALNPRPGTHHGGGAKRFAKKSCRDPCFISGRRAQLLRRRCGASDFKPLRIEIIATPRAAPAFEWQKD